MVILGWGSLIEQSLCFATKTMSLISVPFYLPECNPSKSAFQSFRHHYKVTPFQCVATKCAQKPSLKCAGPLYFGVQPKSVYSYDSTITTTTRKKKKNKEKKILALVLTLLDVRSKKCLTFAHLLSGVKLLSQRLGSRSSLHRE